MNTPRPHWELKLSSLHAVVLVGLITGSMAASFYLGFLSGERAGFESGQEASMAHTARIPIPDSEMDAASEGSVSEQVYDQLAASPKVGGGHGLEEDLPALGKIESAPARNLGDEDSGAGASSENSKTELAQRLDSFTSPGDVRGALEGGKVIGNPDGGAGTGVRHGALTDDAGDTLGALDEPRVGRLEAAAKAGEGAAVALHGEPSRIDAQRDPALPTTTSASEKGTGVTAQEELALAKSRLAEENLTTAANKNLAGSAVSTGAIESARSGVAAGKGTATLLTKEQVAERTKSGVSPAVTKIEPPKAEAAKAAKVVTESAPASNSLVRAMLPKGWYAQVAAPKRLGEAEGLAARLKRSGFPVLIERANVRGEEYFRVVVGPEKDRVQVDRLIGQVKREGFEPFPRAVK